MLIHERLRLRWTAARKDKPAIKSNSAPVATCTWPDTDTRRNALDDVANANVVINDKAWKANFVRWATT
jgi:hypothetical protein